MNHIYCLWCPFSRRIRYIGKTNNLERRLDFHIRAAENGAKHHTARWIGQLIKLNLKPRIRSLLVVPKNESWQFHERRIIAKALQKEMSLTNQSVGGDGVEFISRDDFESAKAARKNGFTKEVKSRMAQSIKLAWADPEKRKRIIEKQKQAANLPERKLSLSKASKMRVGEGEARRLAAVNRYWSNPINRERQAKRVAEANRLKGHL